MQDAAKQSNFKKIFKLSQTSRRNLILNNIALKKYLFEKNSEIVKNFQEQINLKTKKILIENDIFDNIMNEEISKMNKINKEEIKIGKNDEIIPKGNFYFPLESNFKISKSNDESSGFFYKYFGEEKLSVVNRIYENIYKKNIENPFIYDDLITVSIIIHIINNILSKKKNLNDAEIIKKAINKFKKIHAYAGDKNFFSKVKLIIDRYLKENQSLNLFSHLSVKKADDLNFKNLIGTYKQLFCSICSTYVCNIHNIRDESNLTFDNPETYKIENLMHSYKSLLYVSLLSNHYNKTNNEDLDVESDKKNSKKDNTIISFPEMNIEREVISDFINTNYHDEQNISDVEKIYEKNNDFFPKISENNCSFKNSEATTKFRLDQNSKNYDLLEIKQKCHKQSINPKNILTFVKGENTNKISIKDFLSCESIVQNKNTIFKTDTIHFTKEIENSDDINVSKENNKDDLVENSIKISNDNFFESIIEKSVKKDKKISKNFYDNIEDKVLKKENYEYTTSYPLIRENKEIYQINNLNININITNCDNPINMIKNINLLNSNSIKFDVKSEILTKEIDKSNTYSSDNSNNTPFATNSLKKLNLNFTDKIFNTIKEYNSIINTNKLNYRIGIISLEEFIGNENVEKKFKKSKTTEINEINKTHKINRSGNVHSTKQELSENLYDESQLNNEYLEYLPQISNDLIKPKKFGNGNPVLINNKRSENEMRNIDELMSLKIKFCFYKITGKKLENSEKFNEFCEENCCGQGCFLRYLKLNGPIKEKVWNQLGDKNDLGEVKELYFEKLFSIFRYNPCIISKFLRIFDKKNEFDYEISCFSIYFKLLNKGFVEDIGMFIDFSKLVWKKNSLLKKMRKKTSLDTKRFKNIQEQAQNNEIQEYYPCSHPGNVKCTKDNCPCFERGYCEKYCLCNHTLCTINFKGCYCRSQCNRKSCPCYAANRECDKDLCQNCCEDAKDNCGKVIKCKNSSMQRKLFANCAIAKSDIEGWGLFARHDIKKGDFIMEYVGEIIEEDETKERDQWNEIEKITYLFTLNNSIDIDSKSMGNKLRFANHSKLNENCTAKVYFTQGFHKVGLFASKDILKYEEILFDYDGKNELWKRFDWIKEEKKYMNKKRVKFAHSRGKFPIHGSNRNQNEDESFTESEKDSLSISDDKLSSDQNNKFRLLNRKRNRLIKNSMENKQKKSKKTVHSEHNKKKKYSRNIKSEMIIIDLTDFNTESDDQIKDSCTQIDNKQDLPR